MEKKSESKLRNEIHYLTRLIEAHKAIKNLQSKDEQNTKNVQEVKILHTGKKVYHLGVTAPSWTHSRSISSHDVRHLPYLSSSQEEETNYTTCSQTTTTTASNITCQSHDKHTSMSLDDTYKPPSDDENSVQRSASNSLFKNYLVQSTPIAEIKNSKYLICRTSTEESSSPLESDHHEQSFEAMDISLIKETSSCTVNRSEISELPKIGEKRKIDQRTECERLLEGKVKRSKMTNGLTQNKYVWRADGHNSITASTTTRRKNKSVISDKSKFKWKRKSIEKVANSNKLSEHCLCSDGVTMVTMTHGTIPAASFVSRKRRRSSSGSVTGRSFSKSPFIIKRYKMLRVSGHSSTSFSQRRLSYIKKQSSHSPSPSRPKRRKLRCSISKSIHKVWVPSKDGNTDNGNKKDNETPCGIEVKTRRGNKQWISTALVKEKSMTNKEGLEDKACQQQRQRKEVVSIKGNQYIMTHRGKSLKRLPSTSLMKINSKSPRLSTSSSFNAVTDITPSKSIRAKRLLAKSVNRVWSAKRNSIINNNQYCLFYNRFGRCNRGDKCTFIHDPKHIAVCNKFLKGKCNNIDGTCPFSHNIAKEKMPVCSFFLKGICTRENCPYIHVCVGRDAEICPEFIRGYCPLGEECTKQHTLTCPDYAKEGTCPRGKTCPLRHWRKPLRQETSHDSIETATTGIPAAKEPYAFRKLRHKLLNRKLSEAKSSANNESPSLITPDQLEFIPLETNTVPEFIAL